MAHFVPECETYFVAADMVTLAETAAESLPALTITETVLPSRTGFMVYEKAIAELRPAKGSFELDGAPVVGIAWETAPLPFDGDTGGIREDGQLVACVLTYPLIERQGRLVPGAMSYREVGTDLDDSFAADKSFERKFYATHLLMQQTLTWVESVMPDRPTRRRLARAGLPPSDIKVIKLRRMGKAPDREDEAIVAWTHRWLVNGHWRQQFYPSTRSHKPVWISPHVKGPSDKPLVLKEKVTAWVR